MRMSTMDSTYGSNFFKTGENTYPKGRALMQIELFLKRKEGILPKQKTLVLSVFSLSVTLCQNV